METKETIVFNGKSYTVRYVNHKVAGTVLIGSESLQDDMYSQDGFNNKEVVELDETIYAYAEDNAIENYNDTEFEKYVNNYFD